MKLEPNKELSGKRITLRKWDASFENANKLHEAKINNRDHILPWLHWALPEFSKSAEDSYTFLLDAQTKWDKGSNFEYAICDNETNTILGGLGLRRHGMFDCMQYEIGYWLIKDACGNGYMSEALNLIEKEFFTLGAERLVIRAEVDNDASNNVAIKQGYVHEGIMRHGLYNKALQKFKDLSFYSKLSGEYKS